jgi:hypothetical protein
MESKISTESLKNLIINNETCNNNETDNNNITELTTDDIFVNLRLISKIEVGNKLIQIDKYVNIDTSYFQSITRWYKGANRNNTIKFMLFIFGKAFELNDNLLNDKTDDSIQNLLRLNNELKNSINGLVNMKQTYYSDKLIQSEIDVIMDDIQSRLDSNLNYIKSTY